MASDSAWLAIGREGDVEQAATKPAEPDPLSLPNALTIAGLMCSAAWLSGGSGWWALAGLALDEIDGRVARALGQTSELGSLLDWGGDIAMTGAISAKIGGPAILALPFTVAVQSALRRDGVRPKIGSARAALTLYALWEEGFFR